MERFDDIVLGGGKGGKSLAMALSYTLSGVERG